MRASRTLPAAGALLLSLQLVQCGRGASAPAAGASHEGAPIILISIDTLRADHLPAYGYAGVETPALERLRRDAIVFDNAYSHCPLTLPSHLSLLTGLLPPAHGVRDNHGYPFDRAAHPTLPQLLKPRGYATGGAVSAYVLNAATGLGGAFDWYDDRIAGPHDGPGGSSLVQRPGDETARAALDWVQGVEPKPFFLFLHLYEPHAPYAPPEPFRSRYGASYDGEVAASDAVVGRFLDALRASGVYDRAAIALVSDHGEGLGDHGESEHGILLYREVLHVPLFLKLPRSERGGTRVARPVGLVSVLPTLAALAGAAIPAEVRSGSLLAEKGPADAGVYSETYYARIHLGWSELRSLVDERYHYIAGPRPELFDLARDPEELSDASSGNPSAAAAMQAALAGSEGAFSSPGALDADAAARLRALGYLGGATAAEVPASGLPNPRDQVHVHEEMKAAFALARGGHGEEAVVALRRLEQTNPRIFDAQWELGATLARLGRYPEASAAYRDAMATSPSMAGLVAGSLAQAELELGHLDTAAAAARAGLAADPAASRRVLARVALARGDLAQAEAEARLLQGDTAATADGAVLLADVAVRRGRPQDALALLEDARRQAEAGRLGPRPGLQFLRGDALARLQRLDEAEAALLESIRDFPADARAYASLAIVLRLAGRPPADVYAVLDRMAAGNRSPQTLQLAARTLDFVGDHAGARAWQQRADRAKAR